MFLVDVLTSHHPAITSFSYTNVLVVTGTGKYHTGPVMWFVFPCFVLLYQPASDCPTFFHFDVCLAPVSPCAVFISWYKY